MGRGIFNIVRAWTYWIAVYNVGLIDIYCILLFSFILFCFIAKYVLLILSFFLSLQPISQWSSSNVVDWMATLNLAPYTELFKAKDIKGTDLLTLDRDKLGVS